MKVSDYVIQFLADLGIRHIFYVSGGGAMHLNDSLGRNEQIEGDCMLHEHPLQQRLMPESAKAMEPAL